MLKDSYGRVVTNLRIAVTSRCNLNCFYCHREGEKNPSKEIDTERIVEIVKAFHKLGIKKVKITGGEPLVRGDILEIISSLPRFKEISMTTNGVLLSKYAYELKECGLDRVNVSLDTLDPYKYKVITGHDYLNKVLEGIEAAYDAGLTPIKVNTIAMRGININEIDDLLKFTNKFNKNGVNVILQLIELIPSKNFEDYYFNISKLEEKYYKKAYDVKVRFMHRRKQYWTYDGVIEFVKPLDNTEFCMHCNRIRVTSEGKLKLCLLSDDEVDLIGLHGDKLINAIKNAIKLRKPYFTEF